MTSKEANAIVSDILAPPAPRVQRYVPSRYPYTYSADHIRARGYAGSRGEAAALLTKLADAIGHDRGMLAAVFANTYIRENNIVSDV